MLDRGSLFDSSIEPGGMLRGRRCGGIRYDAEEHAACKERLVPPFSAFRTTCTTQRGMQGDAIDTVASVMGSPYIPPWSRSPRGARRLFI
ncbi:hypothetical protein DVU_2454 [Nitratidesulfovibrio vulgaris str. Hildenborough]|uniref:Uncharacterized protein n=1 Tax=Nitratidesulfovibrio vulgaris (strain ATCC 29579 / DSM 644 / CCUG 34227 / NCIMB 8303 / VKM B-1760 / Hildenborough) TaxID=882 RepID=Q728Z8_NITV2|nr:hypothetical protein DVU_2454 [Nitratidesulfovibrio vulgaris str. Hildenborough]